MDISQIFKNKYYGIRIIRAPDYPGLRQKEWWVPGLRGGVNRELLLIGYKVSVKEEEKVPKMDGGDGCLTKRAFFFLFLLILLVHVCGT